MTTTNRHAKMNKSVKSGLDLKINHSLIKLAISFRSAAVTSESFIILSCREQRVYTRVKV